MSPAKQFNFEDYARQQFEEIKDILKNLNSTFVPREEILLMSTQTHSLITSLTATVEHLNTEVVRLKEDADQVKGGITLLKGAVVLLTAIAALVGGLWWTVH